MSGKADVFPIGSRGGRYFKNPMAPYLSGKFGTRLPDQRGQKWSFGHLTVIALTIALNCLTRHQGLMSTSSRFSPSWTTKVSSLVVALLYLAGMLFNVRMIGGGSVTSMGNSTLGGVIVI